MEKITITPIVRQKLDQLLKALIYKDYFSYTENALKYHDAIVDFIYTIPKQRTRPTNRKKYGAFIAAISPINTQAGMLHLILTANFL